MTKLFSHTSYALHTNEHQHTNEWPKQHYLIQLSHTFNNDNVSLPCTKNVTETSFTKFPLFCLHHKHNVPRSSLNPTHIAQHSILMWLVTVSPCTKRRISCHLFRTRRTHWAKLATSNVIVAAWGATVLVSRRPFKFHRPGLKYTLPP